MKTRHLKSLIGVGIICASIGAFAAEESSDVQVFDETVGFEQYVREGQRLAGRNPASLNLKFRVIAVRRELGLTTAEANKAPQDIIINGGEAEGLSEGSFLSVVRKIAVVDPFLDNKQKELQIPFAQVKVIHTQENLAIARIEKLDGISSGAAVGVRGVLIGDYLTSK